MHEQGIVGGYAPAEFLRDIDAHRDAIEAILATPVTTTVRFAPHLRPEFDNTWLWMAERGLFAFAADLSSVAARALRDLQYRNLHFTTMGYLSTELLAPQ